MLLLTTQPTKHDSKDQPEEKKTNQFTHSKAEDGSPSVATQALLFYLLLFHKQRSALMTVMLIKAQTATAAAVMSSMLSDAVYTATVKPV